MRRARINVDGVAYRLRALCSDATGRGVSVKDDERPGVDIAEIGSPESYSMLSIGCGDASVEFGACSRDGGDLYSPVCGATCATFVGLRVSARMSSSIKSSDS